MIGLWYVRVVQIRAGQIGPTHPKSFGPRTEKGKRARRTGFGD